MLQLSSSFRDHLLKRKFQNFIPQKVYMLVTKYICINYVCGSTNNRYFKAKTLGQLRCPHLFECGRQTRRHTWGNMDFKSNPP